MPYSDFNMHCVGFTSTTETRRVTEGTIFLPDRETAIGQEIRSSAGTILLYSGWLHAQRVGSQAGKTAFAAGCEAFFQGESRFSRPGKLTGILCVLNVPLW